MEKCIFHLRIDMSKLRVQAYFHCTSSAVQRSLPCHKMELYLLCTTISTERSTALCCAVCLYLQAMQHHFKIIILLARLLCLGCLSVAMVMWATTCSFGTLRALNMRLNAPWKLLLCGCCEGLAAWVLVEIGL